MSPQRAWIVSRSSKRTGARVADVRLDRQRLVALLPDARGSRPRSGRGTRSAPPRTRRGRRRCARPLRVRLREPDADLGLEVEALHRCVLSRRGGRRARRADSRTPAVRRAHRRRRLHGERHPGLPLADRASGRVTTRWSTRRSTAFHDDPSRCGASTAAASTCWPTPSRTRPTTRSPSSSARGWVGAVVTQNIDLLHERAGPDVVEVHGSIRTSSCLALHAGACSRRHPAARRRGGAPPCPTCGSILKPDVVMFGELLPGAAIDRAYGAGAQRRAHARRRLVARGLARRRAAARGPSFAVVNRGPTALDDEAVLRIDAAAGETLAAVAERLTVIYPDAQCESRSWPSFSHWRPPAAARQSAPPNRRANRRRRLLRRPPPPEQLSHPPSIVAPAEPVEADLPACKWRRARARRRPPQPTPPWPSARPSPYG